MRFIVYARRDSGRSRHVAQAMLQGLQRHGQTVEVEVGFSGVRGDIAVAYGWNNKHIFDAYRHKGGRFVYIDLGYWHRKPPSAPRDGYHKVVLDDWCPTMHMRRGCPDDRFRALNVPINTTRLRDKIIVAGMSAKSARDHGLNPVQWEGRTIRRLRELMPERPIVYRPKPSWEGARPIPGCEYEPRKHPIADLFGDVRAIVTHHSNAAIDAIVEGVPTYCEKGVGTLLSVKRLEDIEIAESPSETERRALLADIAWQQWKPVEMASGACWDYVRSLL